MEYKYKFNNDKEKQQLIEENKNLTLIKIAYHLGENYLVFTDEEVAYNLPENEILGNKIVALEHENEMLKQELSITQDAVNELIFNSLKI